MSLIVKPQDWLTLRTEFHNLRLSDRNDRWYLGSGAMHNNVADDFAARTSGGKRDLGQLVDVTVTWSVNPDVTVMAYYSHFFEDNVTEKFFTTQKDCNFMYVELAVNF